MFGAVIGDNPATRGGQVLIEAKVLKTISRHCQNAPLKPESGGVLLGQRRGIHLHVIAVTEPTRLDRRGSMHFDRSQAGHQEIAIARWRQSGGTVDYVGEWHTHPEVMPNPSLVDREAWKTICHARAPSPMIFIIAGSSGNHWFGLGERDRLHELHLT